LNRTLNIGVVFDEVVTTYAGRASLLLPLAFALFVIPAIVNHLPILPLAVFPLAYTVQSVATFLYQGMVVRMVSDIRQSAEPSLERMVGTARSVGITLIIAGVLAGVGEVLGILLFVIPGLILLTIWAVIAPVIVVENTSVIGSFNRSRALVQGNGLRVFAVIVAAGIAIYGVWLVANAIGGVISEDIVLRSLLSAFAYTFTAPLGALAVSSLYFQLCEVKTDSPVGGVVPAPEGTS
jgi:hypothetical protein